MSRLKNCVRGCLLGSLATVAAAQAGEGDAARVRLGAFPPAKESLVQRDLIQIADEISPPARLQNATPRADANQLAPALSIPQPLPYSARSQADQLLPPPARHEQITNQRFGAPTQGWNPTSEDVWQRTDARSLADSLVPPTSAVPSTASPKLPLLSRAPLTPPYSGLPAEYGDAPSGATHAELLPEPVPPSGYPAGFSEAHARRMSMVLQDEESCSLAEKWHEQSLRWNAQNRHVSEKFITFYDPELVEPYNTDDYETKVVVTSGSVQQPRFGSQSASDLLSRKITEIRPTLAYAWGEIPKDSLPDDFNDHVDRGQYEFVRPPLTVLQWAPTNLWHNPLYFSDPTLERYGHTYNPCIQPFVSGGRFATQLVGLPYQMTLHPVHAREYTLGWYRPGEWAPKKTYQIPFNEEATVVQTLSVVSMFLIFP